AGGAGVGHRARADRRGAAGRAGRRRAAARGGALRRRGERGSVARPVPERDRPRGARAASLARDGIMILGLLPSLGGSIAALRAGGQDSRLIDGYLARYVRAFERVTYFSYAPESIADYTDDAAILAAVDVRAPRRPSPRLSRALGLAATERAALRRCAV